MIKRNLMLLFCCMLACVAMAQVEIRGRVMEEHTGKAVEYASVSLLDTDSVDLAKAVTDEYGMFRLTAPSSGNFILRVSFMGLLTHYRDLVLPVGQNRFGVGQIFMTTNEKVLKEAVVKATLARVEQKEDTTIFNAGAYRVPQGSTVEALVKQLPGVEVDEKGKITWNGKEVKELLVNGKDFFKGKKEVAMKNLPFDMVSRVRAYDKQSDFAEMTGIDDGQERTVLDIMTRNELNQSLISNIDLGYGTEERYTGKAFVSRFTDNARVTAYGSMNNINDNGYGSYKGWGGNNGLVAHKDAGVDFVWDNGKDKRQGGSLELGGSVNYAYVGSDLLSTTASETFLSGGRGSSFSNSMNRNSSSSQKIDAQFKMEWHPDSMTSIIFRPTYNHSSSKNDGNSLAATFNADPYALPNMFNPLDSIFLDGPNDELAKIVLNSNERQTLGDGVSNSVGGELNILRRLNSAGRNISFSASGSYSKSENNDFSISNIVYYNRLDTTFQNQYSVTPSKNWNYRLGLAYTEPFSANWFGELRYSYAYKYNDSDRSRYNLETILNDLDYSWNDPLNHPLIGTLPTNGDLLQQARDLYNSQYATYRFIDHTANVGVRYQDKNIRFNAGVDFNPERSEMEYERPGQRIDTLVKRDVFNVSPQVRLRYRFSPTANLDIRYRGAASQPSMTNLLSVVDNSNPLNISMGNPGLKPSWNNSLRVFYRGFNPMKQSGMGGGIMFNQTTNAVSNLMVYDEATGVRYTRPQNINGNWDVRGMHMFNMGFGKEENFTMTNFANVSYSHSVGYVSSFSSDELVPGRMLTSNDTPLTNVNDYNAIFDQADIVKSKTKSWSFRENLRLGYRNEWFDVGAQGKLNYNHARSTLQTYNNMDTWNFSYGANANFNFDWGMTVSTDLGMSSRRGYSDASMNSDELLWNAQITQSFLKNRAATISFQFYDILQQQSNVSRMVNATMRSDTWNNAINSYCMVHFTYKLNIFGGNGGKKKIEEDNRYPGYQGKRGGYPRGAHSGRGGYPGKGGPVPGGFGGMRP